MWSPSVTRAVRFLLLTTALAGCDATAGGRAAPPSAPSAPPANAPAADAAAVFPVPGGPGEGEPIPDAAAARPAALPDAATTDSAPIDPASVDPFDTTRLHRVEITVASEHLPALESALGAADVQRVPATIVFDGAILARSGIRKKGGRGSWRPLAMKAAFSIKFNELVKGQKLAGLNKLLLNNAVMDPSLMNEHLGHEIARRAGLAAPRTAHAAVTFNGRPYGFFVVREAINDDFLRRSFGQENEDGNLYEGGDFLRDPESPELKDELEEMRTRDDIRELSRLIKQSALPRWIATVGAKLDIASFITGYAVELLTDHWDGYYFRPNNYYIYNHPGTGRFVLILAGLDGLPFRPHPDPVNPPSLTLLGQRFVELGETRGRLHQRMMEIARGLDLAALHARIDEVARILSTHGSTDQRFREELRRVLYFAPVRKMQMDAIKAWRPMATPPAMPKP
jgi:spore coat protein H